MGSVSTAWFGANVYNEDEAEVPPATHCQNIGRGVTQQGP